MPRLRFGVALVLPPPWATEVDGLRRAVGSADLHRVPPHLTLVPPVNVRTDAVGEALAVLRRAAATVRPFTLRLGPVTSFAPVTPTLHLAVDGDADAVAALHRLRDATFSPPLQRPLTFPFEPHVTLRESAPPEQLDAAVAALSGYRAVVPFERVHLLQERRGEDGVRRWGPVADVPFGPPAVVGRGGVELELTTSELVDPEAELFEAAGWPEGTGPSPSAGGEPGRSAVVVVARRRGELVGLVRGWASPERAHVDALLVAEGHRRQGIARHLLAAFDHAAAQRRADDPPDEPPEVPEHDGERRGGARGGASGGDGTPRRG